MARSSLLTAAVLFGATVFASYDQFFFASEATEWKCPDMGFGCIAPQICAHESLLDKYYCCGSGSTDAVCWNGATNCGNSNNEPSTNQIGCSSGDNAFCCLADREECTQRYNQINICWATASNPIANVSSDKMNATFSSLSKAKPSASSWTVDLAVLTATSTPASTSATAMKNPASSSATATASASSTSTQSSEPESKGTSTGAIAGGVVGAIAGAALLAGGAFFLFRRNKSKKAAGHNELDGASNPYANQGYGAVAQGPPQEKYAHEAPAQQHAPPVEMDAYNQPMELEGNKPQHGSQLH